PPRTCGGAGTVRGTLLPPGDPRHPAPPRFRGTGAAAARAGRCPRRRPTRRRGGGDVEGRREGRPVRRRLRRHEPEACRPLASRPLPALRLSALAELEAHRPLEPRGVSKSLPGGFPPPRGSAHPVETGPRRRL